VRLDAIQVPNEMAQLSKLAIVVFILNTDFAERRRQESRKGAQKRRLPGSVGAGEQKGLAIA
jgi:hypothetical protein